MPEVLVCYHFAGVVDYQMKVPFKDIDAYNIFFQNITLFTRVRVHRSDVVLRQIKHSTIVPNQKPSIYNSIHAAYLLSKQKKHDILKHDLLKYSFHNNYFLHKL